MLRWNRTSGYLGLLGVVLAAGCGRGGNQQVEAPPPAEKNSLAVGAKETILCMGTSLTAGLGLDPSESWPALLQQRIDSLGLRYRVVNAGVSGETSSGALHRADWLFSQGPIAVLIVETGANDMLRGQSVDSLGSNLDLILAKAQALSPAPQLVVAAMEALPNLGRDYVGHFRDVFPAAAKAHQATLLPFFLDRVAGVDSLNQPDGIHPTRAGERIVAENIWKTLGPMLRHD